MIENEILGYAIILLLTLVFIRYLIAISRLYYYINESIIAYDEKGEPLKREFVLVDGFRYVHIGGLNTFPRELIAEHGLIVEARRP